MAFPIERKNNNIIFSKENRKKESYCPRKAVRDVKAFLKNTTRRNGGWRFFKKPGGLELYSPVRRLIFALLFWFLSAGFYFLFLLINCGTVQLWYWCGGKEAGKKRLRLKGWTVAANSGGTERFADTGQALASLPASGARVADKEP